jgi:hypothetical protein
LLLQLGQIGCEELKSGSAPEKQDDQDVMQTILDAILRPRLLAASGMFGCVGDKRQRGRRLAQETTNRFWKCRFRRRPVLRPFQEAGRL